MPISTQVQKILIAMHKLYWFHTYFLIFFSIYNNCARGYNEESFEDIEQETVSKCSQVSDKLFRLGKSRFYIYDTMRGNLSTFDHDGISWTQAYPLCSQLGELRMAKDLNKVSTNGLIARGIERKAVEKGLRRTVYWIDASYDNSKQRYYWGTNNKDFVQYGNFYYKQPQPIGAGPEYSTNPLPSTEKRNKKTYKEQCLALRLPFMNREEFGFQASWLERACTSKSYRRVLCESTNPDCEENKNRNPHILTEDKEYYFTEGNWIFANRRFIVNWPPRPHKEAEAYCKKYNLELFRPVPADECLLTYLKLWAPVLSTYNFWTDYSYYKDKQEFRDHKNSIFHKGVSKKQSVRPSDKSENRFCVAYQWTYEFKNETRCGIGNSEENKCDWLYYLLAPSNCNNFIGTVCQHSTPDNTRICDFKREWVTDKRSAIYNTAVIEFGYKGSGLWRSTYKQTFGSRVCGSRDRQMIGYKTEYWKVNPEAVDFTYDYEETYWVVDEDLFKNAEEEEDVGLCTVSTVTSTPDYVYNRELKKVNCLEWHFYLCETIM